MGIAEPRLLMDCGALPAARRGLAALLVSESALNRCHAIV